VVQISRRTDFAWCGFRHSALAVLFGLTSWNGSQSLFAAVRFDYDPAIFTYELDLEIPKT